MKRAKEIFQNRLIINCHFSDGKTPLIFIVGGFDHAQWEKDRSIVQRHMSLLKFVISLKPNIDIGINVAEGGYQGQTALFRAAQKCDLDYVKLLLPLNPSEDTRKSAAEAADFECPSDKKEEMLALLAN